ncbi:MAG: ATPase domain-containing protein, partial [Candidatus Moraniibacteriota bacterium]
TGTGKTTMGMHFLQQGMKEGENCIWVALEESVSQLKKVARQRNWELEELEKKGKITFIETTLLDVDPDKLLYDIIEAIDKNKVQRVVFDSISSLESATLGKDEVRQFLIQLTSAFKTRGVTCVLNYLTSEIFGASDGQLLGEVTSNKMRLSSIVDGVILLRYHEHEKGVEKMMTTLKLRGSSHDRGIFKYDLVDNGINIEKKI